MHVGEKLEWSRCRELSVTEICARISQLRSRIGTSEKSYATTFTNLWCTDFFQVPRQSVRTGTYLKATEYAVLLFLSYLDFMNTFETKNDECNSRNFNDDQKYHPPLLILLYFILTVISNSIYE